MKCGPSSRRALVATFVWLTASACHSPQAPQPSAPTAVEVSSPKPEVEPQKHERDAIIAFVLDGYRAGLERKDLDGFMRMWASDATMTTARLEELGPHDITLSRVQIESVRRLIHAWYDPISLRVVDPDVVIQGTTATLAWRAITSRVGGTDVFDERYRLRRTATGWLVTGMRYWPVEQRQGDKRETYSRRYFVDLDEEIEKIRAIDDQRQLLFNLFGGYRFHDASALARELTQAPDADAWLWQVRATLSLCIGDTEDAQLSHDRAEALEKGSSPEHGEDDE